MTYQEAMQKAKREYCAQVLELANGNRSEAARIASLNRTSFLKLLKNLGFIMRRNRTGNWS